MWPIDFSFVHAHPFYELTALLVLAALMGFVGLLLRQPMIVSFIAVGILAGPSATGVISSGENIELLSELGITILLFLVGLKLDLTLIRTLGKVSLATGLGQVLFTAAIGYGIGLALGLDALTAIYVAVALTFSSTIIIIKLLSDKRELDALHGRIATGFLIVQDLFVVFAMMVLSAYGVGMQGAGEQSLLIGILKAMGQGAIMLLSVALFIRYLATPVAQMAAKSPELLIVFSIAWAAFLAVLGHHFGFSKELGGLLAGVSLASTPFREAIVARLSSLRDFLLLFFFFALGAQLNIDLLGGQVLAAVIFSLFVLIGNPLIVMAIMGFMGYRRRTGFLAGLTVAQISEFSLIFMAMGMTLGHVTNEALGLVTLVGLITIALSVYMITYSHALYRWLEPWLGLFERHKPYRENSSDKQSKKADYDVILFGLGRYGFSIATNLRKNGQKVLAIDFNPEVVRHCRRHGYDVMYGDACDPEFALMLPLDGVKWVISAMPQRERGLTDEDPRLMLMHSLRAAGYKGKIVLSTNYEDDMPVLARRGADMVFLPFQEAAENLVRHICKPGK